jgi:hypothetical protein
VNSLTSQYKYSQELACTCFLFPPHLTPDNILIMDSSNSQENFNRQERPERTPLPTSRPSEEDMIAAHALMALREQFDAERQQAIDTWREMVGEEQVAAARALIARNVAYVCQFCGHRCNTPGELDQHTSTAHPTPRPFICSVPGCSAAFELIYQLENHLRFGHDDQLDRSLTCNRCQRNFAARGTFLYHQRSQTCLGCRREFRCARALSSKTGHHCAFTQQ